MEEDEVSGLAEIEKRSRVLIKKDFNFQTVLSY